MDMNVLADAAKEEFAHNLFIVLRVAISIKIAKQDVVHSDIAALKIFVSREKQKVIFVIEVRNAN